MEAEVEAVRDEAMHLPRRLRAGRATLMVGRSRKISIREAGGAGNEGGGGGRSLFLCISYLSHTSSRFFWTQEMDLN
jgi:hypothetical protein